MQRVAVLSAVILAACVAAAGAVAPSEEWAERFRLLEARFEQSEASLHERVAFLEGEVQRLRLSREQAEATEQAESTEQAEYTAPKVWTSMAAVGSMGEPEAPVGRRLSSPTCCRWTPDDTCGSVPADRFDRCTTLHEYLEGKTTTHEFDDLDTCLGSDESKWTARYDGASTNQVTLSNDTVVANLKTPLKVTHAADCGNVPPTLNVQMDTVHDGSLTLGGNTVHSFGDLARKSELEDLASSTNVLYRYDFPASNQVGFYWPAPSPQWGWGDIPDLTHTPTLTKTSTILLVQYQISFRMDPHTVDVDPSNYLQCRLQFCTGGSCTEKTSARSIHGSYGSYAEPQRQGIQGTSSGMWIGAVSAGSPAIKVSCRSAQGIQFSGNIATKALTVAILG